MNDGAMPSEFEDDSSAALGLGHHARSVDDRSWNDRENARLRAQCEREGIPFGNPVPGVIPINRDAYAARERLTRRIQEEHPDWPLLEVEREATRLTAPSTDSNAEIEQPKAPDYLGASIESLMGVDHKVHSGGGGGNRTLISNARVCKHCGKRRKGCQCDSPEFIVGYAVQQMGAKSSSAGSRSGKLRRKGKSGGSGGGSVGADSDITAARNAISQNEERLVRESGVGGRPLKGSEPRVSLRHRIEPTKVIEMCEATGMSTGQLLEEMHALLMMAKTNADRDAVAERLQSLVQGEVDVA